MAVSVLSIFSLSDNLNSCLSVVIPIHSLILQSQDILRLPGFYFSGSFAIMITFRRKYWLCCSIYVRARQSLSVWLPGFLAGVPIRSETATCFIQKKWTLIKQCWGHFAFPVIFCSRQCNHIHPRRYTYCGIIYMLRG